MSPPSPGLWRSLVRFTGRMPLRVKLITTMLVLVIAALVVISIAGVFVLRNYLNNTTDHQVSQTFNEFIDSMGSSPYIGGEPKACAGEYMGAFVPSGQALTPCRFGPPWPELPSASWLKANDKQFATLSARSGGDAWRVYTEQTKIPSSTGLVAGTVIVGEDIGPLNHTIGRLISLDLTVGGITVVCLAIVGIAVVRRSLLPLTEIEQTAGKIAAGDLGQRVAERDPGTEIGSLGRSLNVMLARIEAAFHAQVTSEANARASENRMRRFIADASHELRTPLTTIRGYAEYYRQRGRSGSNGAGFDHEDLDRIMNRVEDEATRMGGLVEDLLTLARIDQQRPLEHNPVDVLALAADAVQDARMVAANREVTLTVGRDTAFLVLGDEARLRQVIGNLLSNALTHTPDGSPVEVGVRSGQIGWSVSGPVVIAGTSPPPNLVPPPPGAASHVVPAVVIEVIDHGPGLSPEQAQRVFERFYRADEARTRKTGGTGLGLAIVSALVTAHGGAVAVESQPGQGATFRVALPLEPVAQGPGDEEPDDDALDPADLDEDDWQAIGPSPWAPAPEQSGPAGQSGVPEDPSAGQAHPGWEPDELPDVVEQRRWKPFS